MATAIVKNKTAGTNVTTLASAKPAFLQKYREDAGKGYSHDADDSLVPFIDVLASDNCPQLKKNNEKFIKGAMVGDIILKGAIHPILPGAGGIVVQPCAFEKCWVEWVPRIKGGGFVTRHKDRPADAVEKPNPEDETRTKWIRKNGNEVIETRYHYVLHKGQPYVIAFKSTGHQTSREWTNLMKLLSDGGTLPSYAREYRLTPKLRTKMDQEWYVFSVDVLRDKDGEPTFITDEKQYLAGQAFEKAIRSGTKQAAAEDDERETEATDI